MKYSRIFITAITILTLCACEKETRRVIIEEMYDYDNPKIEDVKREYHYDGSGKLAQCVVKYIKSNDTVRVDTIFYSYDKKLYKEKMYDIEDSIVKRYKDGGYRYVFKYKNNAITNVNAAGQKVDYVWSGGNITQLVFGKRQRAGIEYDSRPNTYYARLPHSIYVDGLMGVRPKNLVKRYYVTVDDTITCDMTYTYEMEGDEVTMVKATGVRGLNSYVVRIQRGNIVIGEESESDFSLVAMLIQGVGVIVGFLGLIWLIVSLVFAYILKRYKTGVKRYKEEHKIVCDLDRSTSFDMKRQIVKDMNEIIHNHYEAEYPYAYKAYVTNKDIKKEVPKMRITKTKIKKVTDISKADLKRYEEGAMDAPYKQIESVHSAGVAFMNKSGNVTRRHVLDNSELVAYLDKLYKEAETIRDSYGEGYKALVGTSFKELDSCETAQDLRDLVSMKEEIKLRDSFKKE